MRRVVVDTNVLVSSLLAKDGPPARLREAFASGEIVWCVSREFFDEYADVLQRPRLREAFMAAGADATEFLAELARAADWVSDPLHIVPVVPDDPDDDIVIATALAARADAIVTGDGHLLALGARAGVSILSIRALVEELDLAREEAAALR